MSTAVHPAQAADSDLGSRVSNYLHTLNRPSLRGLNVEVRHGEVFVSGTLPSYYEKSLALNACQRVAGVLKLCETIEVDN
jgi:osmotically-inducible protein OsmY